MNKIKEIIKLIKLSKKRFNSKEDYEMMQYAQAKMIYEDLQKILKISKKGFVIDFGCGNGGYTKFFGTKFEEVLGVDFNVINKTKNGNTSYQKCNLLNFKSKKKADLIFCSSVIEHVKNSEKLIQNIYINLKPSGKLYISFPPFYSICGGHQLKPFHYLPERIAIKIGKFIGRISYSVNSYENLFGKWGLYKRRISDVKHTLTKNKFKIIEYKVRYLPINIAKVPLLNEIFTWHVEFYCEKK